MKNDHPDNQTANHTDTPAKTLSIPRWVAIAALLIVLLSAVTMSIMMLVMGWGDPPMHHGMIGSGSILFPIAGILPGLVVLGVVYGVYRLYGTTTS